MLGISECQTFCTNKQLFFFLSFGICEREEDSCSEYGFLNRAAICTFALNGLLVSGSDEFILKGKHVANSLFHMSQMLSW